MTICGVYRPTRYLYVVVTATGNDDGQDEPTPMPHLVVQPHRRRQQWKPKPLSTGGAAPEGASTRDSPKDGASTSGNGDSRPASALWRRRLRRDVYNLYRPRPPPRTATTRRSVSTRTPEDVVEQLRRLRAKSIDDRRRKRPEPDLLTDHVARREIAIPENAGRAFDGTNAYTGKCKTWNCMTWKDEACGPDCIRASSRPVIVHLCPRTSVENVRSRIHHIRRRLSSSCRTSSRTWSTSDAAAAGRAQSPAVIMIH